MHFSKSISLAALLICGNAAFAQNEIEHIPTRKNESPAFGTNIQTVQALTDLGTTNLNSTPKETLFYVKRIWKDVDATDAFNAPFTNGVDRPGQTTLASVLLDGISKGIFSAYGPSDNVFTKKLSKKDLVAMLFSQGSSGFNGEQVTRYRIQEMWQFEESEHKMVVKVTGIAPLKEVKSEDGIMRWEPVFWVAYPEAKEFLGSRKTTLPNYDKTFCWDQYLEGRHFSCKVVGTERGKLVKGETTEKS